MSYMASNQNQPHNPGKTFDSKSQKAKSKLINATLDWADNVQIAAEAHEKFVAKMSTLKKKIEALEQTCIKYQRTAASLDVTRLRKNSLRLAQIVAPYS